VPVPEGATAPEVHTGPFKAGRCRLTPMLTLA
jgi:hypothetical protein